MLYNRKLNQDGMTLLEVLISVIILSLGVLGMAPLMMMSVESNNVSRDVIRATELGRERLEFYEALDSLPVLPFQRADSALIEGSYQITTYIEDSSSDTLIPPGIAYITVAVGWMDNLNIRRTSSFTSILEKSE
ncbi:MAG: prepilin-type N-terminal cleavage/methylation domain-containing protein [bacterium]|nr:prepilin-type N-terminal cleavage/methylation domain-containing protein [bacterium]